MNAKSEWKTFSIIVAFFLAAYFLPIEAARFESSVIESLALLKWYAREHVLLCLVPAFFIAGAVSVFINQAAVLKYLGPAANRITAYGVASVSGAILAVCSCTVLPLFAGIYRRGAGLGPATAFLYSGPAINILAIILTARVLGWQLGVARAVGAIVFAIVIGVIMAMIFSREEKARESAADVPQMDLSDGERKLWQDALYFFSMVAVLVFANWANPGTGGIFYLVYSIKWYITAISLVGLAVMILRWFSRSELRYWAESTWEFAKQILPLLFAGVLVAGFLLGRPGSEGLIPSAWISSLVGGNGLGANLFASVAGALMYFATLTEIPILEGLIGSGMGKGPALALLLAGPAVSLPNLLVIYSYLGAKKTSAFAALVIVMATAAGMIFGAIA